MVIGSQKLYYLYPSLPSEYYFNAIMRLHKIYLLNIKFFDKPYNRMPHFLSYTI